MTDTVKAVGYLRGCKGRRKAKVISEEEGECGAKLIVLQLAHCTKNLSVMKEC